MEGRIHIGTSGWVYKHWKPLFYPERLASAEWLSYYAQFFRTVEINGSFYRLPSGEAVMNWMEQVPDDFRFCPKIHRFLSHMKKLRDPEDPLRRFFEVFDPLQKMMGPLLIQLPPIVRFNFERAFALYELLESSYSDYSFVIEIRHESWLSRESLQLMKQFDIGLVISQSGTGFPYTESITSRNVYIRFHGPSDLYASGYSDKTLRHFAKKFKEWQMEGHDVWAFFNNDIGGYAIANALRMHDILHSE